MALQRAEGRLLLARGIGPEGVAGLKLVLFDPAHALAVDRIERRLHRRVHVGVVADIGRARVVDRSAPPAAARRDLGRGCGPLVAGAEQLLLDRVFLAVAHRRGEEDLARRLVDAFQRLDRIVAARDRAQAATVAVVEIEVVPAALFRGPDEVAVLQRLEAVGQRHPGGRALRSDDTAGARRRIDAQQVQGLLVARQALDVEGPPVLGPVDAGQIDVGVGAQVDLDPFTGLHVLDIELDHGVGTPGARIALLDHRGAAAGDVQARDDVDGAFVRALQSDEALVRAPPVAGVAIQLFLSDELRRGPGDQAVAVRGDRLFSARGQVQHHQILIAHEADIGPLGRDLGVDLIRRRFGQAPHAAVSAVGQEDVAFQRGQDVAALFIPGIFDHAALRNPHPLAPRLLGLGQFARVRDQGAGVDQLERLAALHRRSPQVQHIHVVLARTQEGDQITVRRQADALGHRSRQ
ncbi:hypothetical protein D3C72_953840 [compost metagenome]